MATPDMSSLLQCVGPWLLYGWSIASTFRGGGRNTNRHCATLTAAEPGEQPMLGAVTPAQKKESKTKSVQLVRDDKAGPSEQEEEGQRKSPGPCPWVSCKMCEKVPVTS